MGIQAARHSLGIRAQGGRALDARDTATACARICDDYKAEDVAVLDVRELTQITDYFVLCTGASARQLKAIAESMRLALKGHGVTPLGREGEPGSGWILLDYVDVLVHIFSPDARAYYQLELLWGDAPRVPWRQAPPQDGGNHGCPMTNDE